MESSTAAPTKVGALDLSTGKIILFGWPEQIKTAAPLGAMVFPRASVAAIPLPRIVRKIAKAA